MILPLDALLGLALFAFVASITPGPNNLMLMSSGVNFGLRKTLPHLSGVSLGFMLLTALVGVGALQFLFETLWLFTGLKVVCAGYLLYLAFQIARASELSKSGEKKGKAFSFWQAVLFQWVNPKAWTMAISSISLFAPDNSLSSIAAVVLIFGAINLPCITAWTLLGTKLQRWLSSPSVLRRFNYTMAALLVLSLIPLIY